MQKDATCNIHCLELLPPMSGPFAGGLIKAPAKRVRTFLKPHIFYPYLCGGALKPLLRALSKRRSFGERIHWFRVGERKDSSKFIRSAKNFRMRWKVALFHIICRLKHIVSVSYTKCDVKAFLVLHFKPDSGSINYKLTFSKWET